MAAYYGPVPPPMTFGSRPELRRPSQPSLDASISDLTRKNAVYFPNYRVYRGETPATLNYNYISHVFYAFAHVSPDGGVFVGCLPHIAPFLNSDHQPSQLSDEWADAQMPVDGATGCLGAFMRLKQQHEYLKVILSIGGGAASQNFAAVASSAVTRDNFGQSAKGLVEASGFDGIDSK